MNNPTLASIIAFLLAGNTVLIVRHGNAARAERDFERRLSEKGVIQGRCTREHIARRTEYVGLVLSSIAPRAADTVTHETWPAPVLLEQLYIPTNTPAADTINAAFEKLGYAPLNKYWNDEDIELGVALQSWADNAAAAIDMEVGKILPDDGLLVIGCHAIMSQMLAVTIAIAVDANANIDDANNANLGEGEALEIFHDRLGQIVVRHLDADTLGHHGQQPAPNPATTG